MIIMGALVHKLCRKGGCNSPVSFQEVKETFREKAERPPFCSLPLRL